MNINVAIIYGISIGTNYQLAKWAEQGTQEAGGTPHGISVSVDQNGKMNGESAVKH